MKLKFRLSTTVVVVLFALTLDTTRAQTPTLILTGVERITDTGVDSGSVFRGIGSFRKYRREINLVGTINGVASVPLLGNNYLTGIVDQSDATGQSPQELNNRIELLGFTSRTTLNDVSGRLIIKEATYETQRLANSAVILVFPRSGLTYSINGEPYVILTPTPNPPGSAKWINLSTRVFAGTGANSLIVGFVVAGNIPKNFLVRVSGPSLAPFGLTGLMPDPKFQIFAQGATTPTAENDDWGGSAALVSTFTSLGAFAFTSPASKDAARVVTLAPGGYTVVVNATATNLGVALVEVYEL